MTFEEILDQAVAMLQRRGRVTYRALKVQFHLDDEQLEALKEELLYAQQVAVDEDHRVLVWAGGDRATVRPTPKPTQPVEPAEAQEQQPDQVTSRPAEPRAPEAERRQLTVLFCDLVESTALSSQLDPEEWREVVRAYQQTCAEVIQRFEGHIAQYLGDGLLVYFGYPQAHEDDAQRAVRAGLGMVETMEQLNTRLVQEQGVRLTVRVGIHTGLVVVGDMGGGGRQERLALGDTPNIAARLQGLAAPNTVAISDATYRLVLGYFTAEVLGPQTFKGVASPVQVYRVLGASGAQSRLDVAAPRGLTPLVGREQEVALLLERWAQVKDGVGQVVLLSGEAGIGKSRLVQVLTEHVATEPQAWLTPCQCSPYHQHSALYPMIELLERLVLRFDREESRSQKLSKLEGFLVQYGLPLAEAVPLFAALLALPLAADYTPLNWSLEQQKQRTLQALLTILLKIAAQQPVLFVMEDRHWVDPSTLEFLSLLVNQGPTARILALLTFRPDFSPPWTGRSHLTHITVNRLPRRQAAEMTGRVARGKTLPVEVVEQVVAKTDGVPLFVEELTKMVLESGLLREREDHYELAGLLPPLAIPATLHDSLMARLDRLATVKEVAQLGAMLGREFPYELLQAVSPWDEATLQHALGRLVEAELLYQRGMPLQATYLFKHALIQETAYQSVLRSTRQQSHRLIAQVLEERFPEVGETQPELLAHHYTEAGLSGQAVGYWQRAGQRAIERSAHVEAIAHLTKGLELLKTLPDTLQRRQQELVFQTTLGPALMLTKGNTAPDAEHAYARARELCQQVGETPQLFPVLWGLWRFYLGRGELQTAHELGEQLLAMAQRGQDPVLLLQAHLTLGWTLYHLGQLAAARTHLEQSITLYDPHQHRSLAVLYGRDPGVVSRYSAALVLWLLGYPSQALRRSHEAITLAQELSHPFSLRYARFFAARLHQLRREGQAARERAEVLQEFPLWLGGGTILHGWALTAQGQGAQGIAQMCQGVAANRAARAAQNLPYYLAPLAEAYGQVGQPQAELEALAEALAVMKTTGERYYKAELHRLEGELLLVSSGEHRTEAEARFQQALDIARHQQAKSLELRAALSLSRLRQRQGKRDQARELLAPIYGWFTEGFDTADLQEAQALLEALS